MKGTRYNPPYWGLPFWPQTQPCYDQFVKCVLFPYDDNDDYNDDDNDDYNGDYNDDDNDDDDHPSFVASGGCRGSVLKEEPPRIRGWAEFLVKT